MSRFTEQANIKVTFQYFALFVQKVSLRAWQNSEKNMHYLKSVFS